MTHERINLYLKLSMKPVLYLKIRDINFIINPLEHHTGRRKPEDIGTEGAECSMFQGLGCLSIKAIRELCLERRETFRSISGVGVQRVTVTEWNG